MTPDILLIIFIVIGVVGRVGTITVAACLLLVIRILNLQRYFPMLERRSLELGLLFLMISVLIPMATGRISARDLAKTIVSPAGFVTLLAGVAATVLNERGLNLLQKSPALLISVVFGSVIGIVLFDGIPVGPLMAMSLASLLLTIISILR